VSDVSNISYAGYLLKRSNRPFVAVTPFPSSDSIADVDVDDDDHHEIEENGDFGQLILGASSSLQDINSDINNIMLMDPIYSSKAAAPTHSPQHLLLEPRYNAVPPATDESNSNNRLKVDVDSKNKQTEEEQKQNPLEAAVENSLQFAANFFNMKLPAAATANEKDQNSNSTSKELVSSNNGSRSLPVANSTSTISTNTNMSECPPSPPSHRIPRSNPIKMVTTANAKRQLQSSQQQQKQQSLMQSESSQADSFVFSHQSSLPPPSRSIY
jgi:hypothetical protein